jgi:hypothetical protein
MHFCTMQLLHRAPHLPASLTALSAWSFASLKHSSPALSAALAQRAVQLAARGQLRPLDASQLVRAAARLGQQHEAMFRACAEVQHAMFLMFICLGWHHLSLVVYRVWVGTRPGLRLSSTAVGCYRQRWSSVLSSWQWPLDASQLVRTAARLGQQHEAMFRGTAWHASYVWVHGAC